MFIMPYANNEDPDQPAFIDINFSIHWVYPDYQTGNETTNQKTLIRLRARFRASEIKTYQ